jgi:hypothetical protein
VVANASFSFSVNGTTDDFADRGIAGCHASSITESLKYFPVLEFRAQGPYSDCHYKPLFHC